MTFGGQVIGTEVIRGLKFLVLWADGCYLAHAWVLEQVSGQGYACLVEGKSRKEIRDSLTGMLDDITEDLVEDGIVFPSLMTWGFNPKNPPPVRIE